MQRSCLTQEALRWPRIFGFDGSRPARTARAAMGLALALAGHAAAGPPPWAGGAPATRAIALEQLSLRDAIGLAIARHPDIARSHAEIAQGAAQVSVAKAAWYPKLEYGLRPGYGGSFGAEGNRAGARASVGVSQLLHDFGRTASRISAADATLSQRTHQADDTVEGVAYQTAAGFIELAAGQEIIAAAQRQVDALQQTRAKIHERVRAGLSLPSDANVADLALLRAQAAVMKAQTRLDVAAARVNELIGVRPHSVERLAATVRVVRDLGSEGGDVERTPAVLAAAAAVEAADARVRLADAERYPSISVGVNRSQSLGRADVTNDRWVGLQVTGSYGFGGLAQHQRDAALAELRASQESLENQRLVTRSALSAAEIEAQGAAARREGYDKVVALSRASRDLYWQEYMLNKRTLTDVVNPERDIYDAEVEGINALADGTLARIKAYTAVGRLVTLLREHEEAPR
ncbi:TolC family protein [Comamonas endophytica]|uniref:TolC family protein n=1 Tax=Comamonas endophytica TaxID=2949090 RepID=A0ABY6GBR2_9BURK|nr:MULTISPECIES: TolC family protein [unclassified Acidovorax]MCD2513457.1 TolC family protein [Acidovorax sp. D4N7]UYG52527.1 TolC family protein [Acidovorax sp. 5MLIR]